MLPELGVQHAGQQVDQRRLARAVGADQRMARALLDAQRDIVGRDDAAEALDERAVSSTAQVIGAPVRQVQGRIRRSRPTSTSTTRNRPSQKVQYCGVQDEIRSCSSLNAIAPMIPPYR